MPRFRAVLRYEGSSFVEKTIVAKDVEEATVLANNTTPSDLRLLWSDRKEEMKLIRVEEIKES
jgi:hypothetical protein